MSLVGAVRDYLAADAALTALLPGGVHTGTGEISRQKTPEAFDANGELLPCALVTATNDTVDGPTGYAGRLLVSVWLYHRTSDAANETAAARVRTLLHKHPLPGTYEVRWAFGTPSFEEEALAARGAVVRFEVIRKL